MDEEEVCPICAGEENQLRDAGGCMGHGLYYCDQCERKHRIGSLIGEQHYVPRWNV